jgi:hypothetical protein
MTSTTASPISIHDMPVEILAKILVLTVDRALPADPKKFPVYLTRITSRLRNVAMDTPEIWRFLTTTCRIYELAHDSLVNKPYMDFISWWSERLGNRNQFSLRFQVDFVTPKEYTGWVDLKGPTLRSLVDFIARARYLEIEGRGLKFLLKDSEGSAYSGGLPVSCVESIEITATKDPADNGPGFKADLSVALRLFEIPALRKLVLSQLRLRHIPSSNDSPSKVPCEALWRQLTHIKVSLVISLPQWRRFIRNCTSVESAWINLKLRESPNDGADGLPVTTLPHLRELIMGVGCEFKVGDIFKPIYLPALKTLLFAGPPLSLDDFHRLVEVAPSLERMRLATSFPVDENKILGFPDKSAALANHAPRLKYLILDIPDNPEFETSLRGYVDNMRRSGWLNRQTGALRLDFYCVSTTQPINQAMEDIQQHLDLPENRLENVRMTLRRMVKMEGKKSSDTPFWDLWHDFGADF